MSGTSEGASGTLRGCATGKETESELAPEMLDDHRRCSILGSICALGPGSFRLTAIAQRTPNNLRIGVSEEEEAFCDQDKGGSLCIFVVVCGD